jgi:hypothetical protein
MFQRQKSNGHWTNSRMEWDLFFLFLWGTKWSFFLNFFSKNRFTIWNWKSIWKTLCKLKTKLKKLINIETKFKINFKNRTYVSFRKVFFLTLRFNLLLWFRWFEMRCCIDLIKIQRYGSSRPLSGALQCEGVPWTGDFILARPMWHGNSLSG